MKLHIALQLMQLQLQYADNVSGLGSPCLFWGMPHDGQIYLLFLFALVLFAPRSSILEKQTAKISHFIGDI